MSTPTPIRALCNVSRDSPHWSDAWEAADRVSDLALEAIREAQIFPTGSVGDELRVVVKQRWSSRTLVVVDIGHTGYDAAKGHLPEHNLLPVCIVHFGKRSMVARLASKGEEESVNTETAAAHNKHGHGREPPLEEDHLDGKYPVYWNLRDPSLLYGS